MTKGRIPPSSDRLRSHEPLTHRVANRVRIFLYILIATAACLLTGALSLRYMCSRDQARSAEAKESLVPAQQGAVVDYADLEGLPEAARRYLKHALVGGGPFRSVVDLEVEGEIVVNAESDFATYRAQHRVAPGQGFVWQADVSVDGRSLVGAETLVDGEGRASFWWHSFVPARREGANVDRGTKERLAFDRIYLPHALWPGENVVWTAIDENRAAVTIDEQGTEVTLVLEIDEKGALTSVSTRRWGDQTDDRAFTAIPFGCVVLKETTFNDVTIPTQLSFRWWFGEDREQEFVRPTILSTRFQ